MTQTRTLRQKTLNPFLTSMLKTKQNCLITTVSCLRILLFVLFVVVAVGQRWRTGHVSELSLSQHHHLCLCLVDKTEADVLQSYNNNS